MNKQQWQNRIDELEKELAKLKANPPKREPGERWEPEYGGQYWVVNVRGELIYQIWDDSGYDVESSNNFNIFQTKEEAEFARERTKVMRELDLWATDYSPSMGKDSYSISFSFELNKVCICPNFSFIKSHTFETEEIAEQAIEAIGEERLKKYYFRVVDC